MNSGTDRRTEIGDASNLSTSEIEARLGAIRYLLVGLIQRLDAGGQIDTAKFLEGVRADRAAIDPGVSDRALLDSIFRETEDILQFTLTVDKAPEN